MNNDTLTVWEPSTLPAPYAIQDEHGAIYVCRATAHEWHNRVRRSADVWRNRVRIGGRLLTLSELRASDLAGRARAS